MVSMGEVVAVAGLHLAVFVGELTVAVFAKGGCRDGNVA